VVPKFKLPLPEESIALVPLVESNIYQAWVGFAPGVGVGVGVGVGPMPPSPDGTAMSVVSARGAPRLGVLSAFQVNFWMRVVRSVRPQSPVVLFTP